VVSLAQLGAFFGSLLAGPLADRIGRKKVIMVADFLFTVGAGMMAFSPTIPILMAGRIVVGLGVGIASMIVPVYLAEVSPK
jgi:MFS transporter, SP family, solute carrier family 2 (myo-inositol transporter), member 13